MGIGYKYCKRAYDDELAKSGMRAGLPQVTVDASHLQHLLLERDALIDTFKRYFLAAQAYHQSPHDLRVHEQYTVARVAAVKALGLNDG